jgi:hypothetical protein
MDRRGGIAGAGGRGKYEEQDVFPDPSRDGVARIGQRQVSKHHS